MDWGDMSDMDFMQVFSDMGFDQEQLGEDGQARFDKFMAEEPDNSRMESMIASGIGDATQRGFGALSQYKDMSTPQQGGLQGLMGMATQGIQRVPNRPLGLMGR